jgi:hypothetical protein
LWFLVNQWGLVFGTSSIFETLPEPSPQVPNQPALYAALVSCSPVEDKVTEERYVSLFQGLKKQVADLE